MRRTTTLLALLFLAVPALASSYSLKGVTLPDTRTVKGETLQLVGAGVRNKWFFDVGVLSVYAREPRCDAQALIAADAPKLLQLDLLRGVPADRLGAGMSDSLRDHMPKDAPAGLEAQRRAFEGYFQGDLAKGSSLEFLYVPGTGTIVRKDGEALGPPLEGFAFARVLWDLYLGEDSCCGGTKKDILKSCRARK